MTAQARFNDPEYLKNEQYRSSVNLGARIRLHELFSTNPYDFFRWIFDQILEHNPSSDLQVLELGCGRGDLWVKNLDRIPVGWTITLSDFSAGMLEDAKANLGDAASRFEFRVVDAQSIPFEDHSLDLVIANAMLYHVPDRPKALEEIRRVLKPTGKLHAMTMGDNHMREMDEFIMMAGARDYTPVRLGFNLENGAEQLAGSFGDISVIRYDCNLEVTDVEPLVDYARSMMRAALTPEELKALSSEAQRRIAQDGKIFITKDTGTFIASGNAM